MMTINELYIWMGIVLLLMLIFVILFVFLVIISKKTHAIIEFKSSIKGKPISLFFQDNRYCEWKVSTPEAGLIEDKVYGTFAIESTYIDHKTKNVLIPFNSSFAMSLNVKASKMADDLSYLLKEQSNRKKLKEDIILGNIPETHGINTLRTSVNFSAIKYFVSPILPHNITSKINNTITLRLKNSPNAGMQNILLLIVAALGAIILGGLVLKFTVLKK